MLGMLYWLIVSSLDAFVLSFSHASLLFYSYLESLLRVKAGTGNDSTI